MMMAPASRGGVRQSNPGLPQLPDQDGGARQGCLAGLSNRSLYRDRNSGETWQRLPFFPSALDGIRSLQCFFGMNLMKVALPSPWDH